MGFSSTIGDITELRKIMNENGFKITILSSDKPRKVSFELLKAVRTMN